MTGCKSWTYMKKLDDYTLWVSHLADVEAKDPTQHDRVSGRCFVVHQSAGYGTRYPVTVRGQGYDDS